MSNVSSRGPASTRSENNTHMRNNRNPSMTGPGPITSVPGGTGCQSDDTATGTGTGSPNGRRKTSVLDISSAKLDNSGKMTVADDLCDSTTPPDSPTGSSERGSKACCFCWCCCCSCSW